MSQSKSTFSSAKSFLLLLNSLLLSCSSHAFVASSLSPSAQVGEVRPGTIIEAADEFGATAKVRIDAISLDPKDPSHETFLYSVTVEDPATHTWDNFCEPDPEQVSKAIPLSGYWDDHGKFFESETVITLACTSGVIGKCIRWGYKPWKTVSGRSLKDFHLACVRMTRADYCGNGTGHTKDGTPIDLFDTIGIQEREKGEMEFEAAWSPDGATYVNRPRWGTLEKIVEECPEKLKGRTAKDFSHISVEAIKSQYPETLLYNDSFVNLKNE